MPQTIVHYGPTSPNSRNDGEEWINSTTGVRYRWAGNNWQALPQNVPTVFQVATATAATAGGASAIQIGNGNVLGVYFGSGVPTVSAPKGSLYLRTDGASTTTRAYINTDGATTWTNLTTGA